MRHRFPRSVKAAFACAVSAALITSCSSSPSKTAAGETPSTQQPATTPASGGAPSQAGDAVTAACEAAAGEGALNYVGRTDDDVFAQEIAPFKEKYPDVELNYINMQPQDAIQRVTTESDAHRDPSIDTISGDLPTLLPAVKSKLAQEIDWRSLGVPDDRILPVDGIDLYRSYRMIGGIGYNTAQLKPEDLPDTWEDLVNSKWAGKIVTDPRGIYVANLALVWGPEKTDAWVKDFLSTDKPLIVKGATTSITKVTSGEALITTSIHDAEAKEQAAKGAPVAIKYLDIVPTQDYFEILITGSKHANAAKCFLSWWASPEGLAQQLKYEYKSNDAKPADLPASATLAAIDNEDDASVVEKQVTSISAAISAS
jgi:iron(III) transport system substrate-binding protein